MLVKGSSSSFNNAGSSSVKQVDTINSTSGQSLPMTGVPNSVTKKTKDGTVVSERYYDENGNAYLDIDYTNHGNPKAHPTVPHQHHIVTKDGKPRRGKGEEVK